MNSSLTSDSFFINDLQTEKEHESMTDMEEAILFFRVLIQTWPTRVSNLFSQY